MGRGGREAGEQSESDTAGGTQAHKEHGGRVSTGQLGIVWEQVVQRGHERSQSSDGQVLRPHKCGEEFRPPLCQRGTLWALMEGLEVSPGVTGP